MSLLALDLGTQTGWALQAEETVYSGSRSFKPSRFEGGVMRYLRFQWWLDEIRVQYTVAHLCFEAVRRHAGTDAAHAYGGLLAILTSWCEQHHIPYQGIAVGTIKKHVTGKGNASKREMIQAMQTKGFHPTDDNEADALALLWYSRVHHG